MLVAMRRVLVTMALATIAIAFLLLVWPTPYRYEQVHSHLIRLNRVTGHADALCPDGWHTMWRDPFADLRIGPDIPMTADVCLIAPRRL